MAEADVLGPLRACGEEDFRRRGVGILLEKMMLDFPDIVVAELVGEFDLVECVLVEPEFGRLRPSLWEAGARRTGRTS
jgi:hypothetical protein